MRGFPAAGNNDRNYINTNYKKFLIIKAIDEATDLRKIILSRPTRSWHWAVRLKVYLRHKKEQ